MKVKIITEEGVSIPKTETAGSSAIDLAANITAPIQIYPGAPAQLIPTGIKIDMTEAAGLCGFLIPRSGLGHKSGLVLGNGVGLIDNDYQGELFISAWNRNPAVRVQGMGASENRESITIEPGMRIAQLVFLLSATPSVEFEQVESFEATARGEGGFGSTGTSSRKKKAV